MARFHSIKNELKKVLPSNEWQNLFAEMNEGKPENTGPLLSFLPRGGLLRWRAAYCLGLSVAALARNNMEQARSIMRRLMWHMNEESGNLGWGIPESMGEILSNSPALAKEFGRVLLSYSLETGKSDNYIDHVPLLCSCLWAAGRFAESNMEYAKFALRGIVQGLAHQNGAVKCNAALALLKIMQKNQNILADAPQEFISGIKENIKKLQQVSDCCEDFDKDIKTYSANQLTQSLLPLLPA